ncbi:hypothetical protein KV102_04200 [Mumia sp. zg.B53]|uniref:ABC transporter permease subunit n=1 Tax=Mumia sp. zg.B53 TaxID=2855449 RepID=UPI001C6DF4B7|nr:ABC transporter permease subunit [Mumia sp. zg.B53]MBW9214035.1 hypothetical protein [Mumia sp. zg.B53]
MTGTLAQDPGVRAPSRTTRGTLRVACLLWRRHRTWTVAWLLVTGGLAAAALPGYASTYADADAAREALAQVRHDPATLFLYGRLGQAGTPAQVFAWELGTFLTMIAAVMAILLAVRLTRALDEDGSLELLLSTGHQRRDVARAAMVVLVGVGVGLGVACFAATAAYAGRVDGVDVVGAAVLGLVVALTFLLVGLLTGVLALLLPTTWSARAAGGLAVAVAVGVRAVADVEHAPALQWVAPMSLRALAQPFDGDRVLALLPAAAEAAVLGWLLLRLATSTEVGASLVRLPQRTGARLPITDVTGLVRRLDRRRLIWSGLLITAGAAMFTGLGSGAIANMRSGRIDGGFLGAQLSGRDPAAAYFAFDGTVTALVVAAVCVTVVVQAAADERAGLAEHVRATGAAHSALLRAYVVVASVASLVTLALSGTVSAMVGHGLIGGPHVARDAFSQSIEQWPAVALVIGLTALVVAAAPRAAWSAWLPLLAGGGLTLLGKQLQVPPRVIDLSMFGHTSAGVASSTRPTAQLMLLALATVALTGALILMRRRDLAA